MWFLAKVQICHRGARIAVEWKFSLHQTRYGLAGAMSIMG